MIAKPAYEELEQELKTYRQEVEKYRQLIENLNEVLYMLDLDARVTYVSPNIKNIGGYSSEEIIGRRFTDFVHPDDLADRMHYFQKIISGEGITTEYRYLTKNGEAVWVMTNGRPIFEGKEIVGIQGMLVDITDRKQAEEALRQSEAYYRTIFETSGTAMFIIEEDTTISHMNSNFEKLAGYSSQEAEGKKSWTEFIHPDDVGWMKENHYLRRKNPDAAPRQYEFRFINRHGEKRNILLTADMIPGTNRSIASCVDITEHKQIEQQLRESEEKYRILVETANDAVFVTQDGKIKFTNPQTEEITGLSKEELTERPFYNLIYPEDRDMVLDRHKRRISGEDLPNVYTFRIINSAGEVLWVELSTTLFNWEDRPATINFLRDITQQKKLESQLRQAQKMEAIGTLAGGIAHDFNNILSSVLGYTELSLEEVKKGSLVHQNLSQVLTAGNHAKDLVKQILAFGRKEEQEIMPIPVVPLVKEPLKMLRSAFPSFIEIRENISIEQGVVYADPTQLHQVIVNLATNAKQAMSDEGGILEVSVETVSFDENIGKKDPDTTAGNYVRISVSDTGCGISGPYLDRIFEPYFTTSETGTGTGLGLSVVHGIVKAHNGHIAVYSEPGKGTNFHVYLPLAEQEQSRAASTVQEYEALPTGTENVLIVDDEKPIVEMQQKILEGLGYNVTSRTSSAEALEAYRANPDKVDIVITDMTMPDMTGDKLPLKIKEIRPDVPVILCTGFSEKISDQKKGELGIEGYMLKPVTKTDLANMVRKILDEGGNDM